MKTKLLLFAMMVMFATYTLQAQTEERYIEVVGTSELEIVPDKIHYIIEIREYFEEEFDGKSKPEEYRTKVPLEQIEQKLRQVLAEAGVSNDAIRTQEIGDYWRRQGQDFLVSKRFDITLRDFKQIDKIVKRMDTRGVNPEKSDLPGGSARQETGKRDPHRGRREHGRRTSPHEKCGA